jgi:hypothetical protein
MAVHSVPEMMQSQEGYNEKLQKVTQGLSLPNPCSEEKDDQSSKADTLYKLLLVLNIIFNLLSSCHCCQTWNKADVISQHLFYDPYRKNT